MNDGLMDIVNGIGKIGFTILLIITLPLWIIPWAAWKLVEEL